MERRDFLKLCSLAGLGVVSLGAPGLIGTARAATPKLWVFVHAIGGWDPTLVADPKGNVKNSEDAVVNKTYAPGAIGTAGNIKYAPIQSNKAFFERFSKICTVLNGIDCETNGHDSGVRNTWSGRLNTNTPCFAALLAAAQSSTLPLAFITNGGYDFTDDVVASTRLGDVNALTGLIFPNRINPGDDKSELYYTEPTINRIRAARADRLKSLQATQNLPRLQSSMSLLYTSRLGIDNLKKLAAFLPQNLGNGLARQANIALAAYKAGLTQCVNLAVGGYDTHGNHDAGHEPRIGEIMQGVMALYDRAEALGVADDMFVVLGSDFGRTPKYNAQNGKDHWSVGSVIILSPHIPGNRVIGATDDTFRYKKIDLSSLTVGSGDVLKNGHIHRWMRKFAGIADHPIVRRYPISVEGELNLG